MSILRALSERFSGTTRHMGLREMKMASKCELGTLVQNLQRTAGDSSRSLAEVLRNALVLSEKLGRPVEMHAWLLAELQGYPDIKNLPDYRVLRGLPFKGTFMTPFGQCWKNMPISVYSCPEAHRKYLEKVHVKEGCYALEALLARETNYLKILATDAVVSSLRHEVFEDMAMVEAWWETSPSTVGQILENVRWRITSMTIDLEKEYPAPPTGDEVAVDVARVTQIVNQTFHAPVGNVASGSGIVQSATVGFAAGDFVSLASSLREIGVQDRDIIDLEVAILKDREEKQDPMKGRVGTWLSKTIQKLLAAGGSVGMATATQVLPKLLSQYLGLK